MVNSNNIHVVIFAKIHFLVSVCMSVRFLYRVPTLLLQTLVCSTALYWTLLLLSFSYSCKMQKNIRARSLQESCTIPYTTTRKLISILGILKYHILDIRTLFQTTYFHYTFKNIFIRLRETHHFALITNYTLPILSRSEVW